MNRTLQCLVLIHLWLFLSPSRPCPVAQHHWCPHFWKCNSDQCHIPCTNEKFSLWGKCLDSSKSPAPPPTPVSLPDKSNQIKKVAGTSWTGLVPVGRQENCFCHVSGTLYPPTWWASTAESYIKYPYLAVPTILQLDLNLSKLRNIFLIINIIEKNDDIYKSLKSFFLQNIKLL